MKNTKRFCTKFHHVEWMSFIFLPIIVFPLLWTIATLADSLLGDSSVVLRILYDSKGQLLGDFLTDWVASLPVSLGLSWLVLLPVYYLYAYRDVMGRVSYIIIVLVASFILGVWLYRIDMVGLLTMMATGGLLAGALELLSRLSIRCRKLSC